MSVNFIGFLYIGYVRGVVFGDSLVKIVCFLGYEVLCEYYVNDMGF